MEAHPPTHPPTLAAGTHHDFRRSNRRLPVAVRDANADAGARVARGTRACAPAWPGPSPRAGAGVVRRLAGVAAAAVVVAVAPAVGRGAVDGLDRAAPRNDAVVRYREPATPPVASVLMPAPDAGVLPASVPAEARP